MTFEDDLSNLRLINIFADLRTTCSSAVEQTPCDREVMGLKPTGCWAFSFSSFSSVSLIRSLMEVQHY